jgi:hypothetical protein
MPHIPGQTIQPATDGEEQADPNHIAL